MKVVLTLLVRGKRYSFLPNNSGMAYPCGLPQAICIVLPESHYTRFQVANLTTSRCNGIWKTTLHNIHNGLLPAPTRYELATVKPVKWILALYIQITSKLQRARTRIVPVLNRTRTPRLS